VWLPSSRFWGWTANSARGERELSNDGVDKFLHQSYVIVQPFQGQTKAVNFSGSLCRRAGKFLETHSQAGVIAPDGFIKLLK
jgi:hypothetical protein